MRENMINTRNDARNFLIYNRELRLPGTPMAFRHDVNHPEPRYIINDYGYGYGVINVDEDEAINYVLRHRDAINNYFRDIEARIDRFPGGF